jgi:hypothetical protein
MGFFKTVLKGAGKVVSGAAGVAGDVAGGAASVAGDLARGAGKAVSGAAGVAGDVASGAASVAGDLARGAGKAVSGATEIMGSAINSAAFVTVKGAERLKDGTLSGIDKATDLLIPNKSFMKEEVKAVKQAGLKYNRHVKGTQSKAIELHELRADSGRKIIKNVEIYINTLANTPKELDTAIAEYVLEYKIFDHTIAEISEQVAETNESFSTASGGGTLAGVGVGAFAPSAAMAFATTFGSASTGAAISSLSGAAATNAALAWLGGGAAAAGGGGMAAGNSLLAMAGPIGWSIGGIALIGSGYMMNKKCLENANEAIAARKNIEKYAVQLEITEANISSHIKVTKQHIGGIKSLLSKLRETAPKDYREFSQDQKIELGALVNHITALAGLLNSAIK